MYKFNLGRDLYVHGRIGWRGLSKDEYLEKSDYRIINATALMDGYVDWNNCGFITKERYEESFEIMLKEGDILISKDGTLGKIGYVKNIPGPCSVASGIFVVRNTIPDKLNFDYLYHILKSPIFKDFIRRNKVLGSTIPHLYQRDLEEFELDLPSLDEQTKIASVLNCIDNKIAVNNEINDNLQQLINDIYCSWFENFNYPSKNKLELRYNNTLRRDIPNEWTVVKMLEVTFWETNSQPPKSEFVYSPKPGYIRFIQNRDYDSNEHITYIPKTKSLSIVNRFDILMDKYGDAGTVRYGIEGAFNVALAKIGVKKENMLEYVRCFLSSKPVYNYLHNACMASTRASLSEENIKPLHILLPPDELLTLFENKVHLMRQAILKNIDENEKLVETRNKLLPMLMNGQVSVR